MRNFSKREFLATFLGSSVFFFLNQSKASTILENLLNDDPGPLEQEIMSNTKKQILLAEADPCMIMNCTPAEYKQKCQESGLCGPLAK